jgi:TPP-dependent pyruvate/acetoin dehydrogenase alpha subunit
MDCARAYEQIALIRRFEETVLEMYGEGRLAGTTHTCIGQEANAVGIIAHLNPARDNLLSNHRNHGHYLAYSDNVDGLLREIMGRQGGVCGGRGGSQHLHHGRFLSNGVQGGMAPVAAGMAMAEKRRGSGAVTVVFLGDGTLGQGVVYETLNMVALWSLPLLMVVENNRYAQTTPVERAVAGSMTARAEAFGVASRRLDSTDVHEIHAVAGEALSHVRLKRAPFWLVVDTYRFAPHSKGDDFRPEDELERYRKIDPIRLAAARLSTGLCAEIDERVRLRIAAARDAALSAPPPEIPAGWTASHQLT